MLSTTQTRADATQLRAAIEQANPNVLRMALYHMTGDESLARMKVNKVPLRGGAFFGYLLDESHHEEVFSKAVDYLLTQPDPNDYEIPEEARLKEMMEMLTGGTPLSEGEFQMGREELALEEFPRLASWSEEDKALAPEGFRVLIVGAGASGVAAAVQLERLGIPYVIYERQGDLGGTWEWNRYPDVRVDTNSYLYQFKFEKKYPWSEYFATAAEVKAYIGHIADKYGVKDQIRTGMNVVENRYDPENHVWHVQTETATGKPVKETFNVIISASGMFSTARYPDIPGIESFEGQLNHTTEWDEDYDASGRCISVIGNGSTGVQLLSPLAEEAKHVYAFVRTPQWVSPMEGYREEIPEEVKWVIEHMPTYWNWYCYNNQMTASGMQGAQVYDRGWQAGGGIISPQNDGLRETLTKYIHSQLGDRKDLIEKLTPDYAPLARRLVVDNSWYKTLLRPNVSLVTEGIKQIHPNGIETQDGVIHEVDTIVIASGFDVAKYLWPTKYVGANGESMEDVWEAEGPRAYLGLTVPDFPNLFIFYGPNSQPRAGSFLSWIEIWARYVGQALVDMIEAGAKSMEVRKDVFTRYNEIIDAATHELIWEKEAPAGRNYYVNKFGRQNVNVPLTNGDYFLLVKRPNLNDFILR